MAERYRGDDDRPPHYADWLRLLTARLPTPADVLDLGCGCGVPMSRDLAALGHRVLGVDLSAVQIERARRLVPDAVLRRADATELDLPAASLDGVVCLYTLIHLPRAEQEPLVHRIRRWFADAGLTVVHDEFVPEDTAGHQLLVLEVPGRVG